MKRLAVVLIFSVLLPLSLYAQNDRQKNDKEQAEKDRARIEQLEKIKLIEVLNLSEETIMKFFARRNDYFNRVRYINEERRKIADNLDDDMKKGKKYSKRYYQNLINRSLSLDKEAVEQRAQFYTTLNDILTTEQIAKLLVFARRFNEWVMNEAFKNNKPQK